MSAEASAARLPALLPRGPGHQFVVYGDSCSGIAGAVHEKTFASVNAVVRRLEPPPEFIAFLGDEVAGLTADRSELEAQWRHWLAARDGLARPAARSRSGTRPATTRPTTR